MPQKHHLTKLQETLTHLDLTPKESRTYTVMLAMGPQSASVLSKRLEMGRSSAQFITESLVKKELATKSTRHNVTYYTPVAPEEIPHLIEARAKAQASHWQEVHQEMSDLVPELRQISQVQKGSPKIKFYEGKEGVKYVAEDALKAQDLIRTFYSYEGRSLLFPESYFDQYRHRREDLGLKVRALYPDTEQGQKTKHRNEHTLKKVKLVDHKKYKWEPEIRFYDNKVSIVSHQEQVGVIIESEMISHAMQTLFDLAWDNDKK